MTYKKYVFVVTGMSYIIDSSGTSKVVKAHEEIFNSNDIGYVVAFPICKSYGKSKNRRVIKTGCFGLVKDGIFCGVVTSDGVLNYLIDLEKENYRCKGILIHHLIRNDINQIINILQKIQSVPIIYYLHDFFTCCVNPVMLKNDKVFCLNGTVSCNDCFYNKRKLDHLEKINDFFLTFENRLRFIAPSEYVKEKWISLNKKYAELVDVIPHQKEIGRYDDNRNEISKDQPVKIAFVGSQTDFKGWKIFKRTIATLSEIGCNYEYYYFGNGKEKVDFVENVIVDISSMGKNAMINSLRKYNIDVVMLISICGETYSYTMYESRAANTYILTFLDSGNIAYKVEKENWGKVLKNENDLISSLIDETRFRNDLNHWRLSSLSGANEYIDNGQIVNYFSGELFARINWTQTKVSLYQKIKNRLLCKVFFTRRLKSKI